MPAPIGFFSYATSDDESSRGRLSQLRQRLAAELQQQVGRSQKVQIFQDVASIPLGASWERQIREGLAASSFLIPILTPAFFQSEWCCREVLQFREREAVLGRDDLIFPIHYIDTDHLDPALGVDCWSAEVYALLRTRQIANFRALRFKDYDSEAVLTALDRVAVSIRDALRVAKRPVAPQPPQNSAPPPPVSADGASGESAEVALWRRKAAAGDLESLYFLGSFYSNGLGGLVKDDREAARLYKLAADQGYSSAQAWLGYFYANGRGGLVKDDREAARFYKLAADQGHRSAQTNLGYFYAIGRGGLDKNEREAARLHKLAADQGNHWAQYNLGVYYENGRGGLAKNKREAIRYYKLAADQGHADAKQRLKELGET